MMTTKPAFAALTLAALLTAVPALASPGRGAAMPMLQDLDFGAIDTSGDGAITLDEWRTHVTGQIESRREARIESRVDALMQGDADGDGALSREELTAHFGTMMEQARTARAERMAERSSGDGAERGPMRRAERGMGRPHRGHGMRHGGRGPGAGFDLETMVVRSFQRLDVDGDAAISREEFDTAVTRMQERMERRAERMERRGERSGRD